MSEQPIPLPVGTLLADRFEIESVLGRGAFGIVYLGTDLNRNDSVVIKELAPRGIKRQADGSLELPSDSAQRLRQSFLDEAKILSRLHVRGVLPVRMGFVENGTAYFATDYLPNAQTLESLLRTEGRMDVDGALDILFQVLDILEAIHAKNLLHRDLKPSNILVGPKGEVTLIDFGAAREWQADYAATHTVLFTPDYAPLEQMTERARRGPGTDLYALAATAYEMLAGRRPEPATERASGIPLTPLAVLRPDVGASVASAIESALALKLGDRPQTAAEFRELFQAEEEEQTSNSLLALDSRLVRLQQFTFERRQCPSCRGLLEEAKPLRAGVCPVCQDGAIKPREIHRHLCPGCRNAILKRVQNTDPIQTCPQCQTGWLKVRRKGLLSKEFSATCPECNAEFSGKQLVRDASETGGRSEFVWHCDECDTQLDEQPDGRLKLVKCPKPGKYVSLYPEEWDCVAAGLEPGSGNAECSTCRADFYVDRDYVTLLAVLDDPYEFAKENLGRLLTHNECRWMAAGKTSPNPGLVCMQCHTEFDRDGDYLRLVRSPNRRLQTHLDEPNKLIDWHRIASDLPTVVEEPGAAEQLIQAIVDTYRQGEIGFDNENSLIWKGPAANTATGASGTLSITTSELQFGGLIRKIKLPLDAILVAQVLEDVVEFSIRGESEPLSLQIQTVDLTIQLESGRYTVELGAAECADRINFERSGSIAVP